MSSVIPFRSARDRDDEVQEDLSNQMVDEMCAIVDGHQTLTGINACLNTLAVLIVGYGMQNGGTDELAQRCGTALSGMVKDLQSDMGGAA